MNKFKNVATYILEGYEGTIEPQTLETFPQIANDIHNEFIKEVYNTPSQWRINNYNERAAFERWCSGLPSIIDTNYYYNRSAISDLENILKINYIKSESVAEHIITNLLYETISLGIQIYNFNNKEVL